MNSQRPSTPRRRYLLLGESAIAPVGLTVAAILMLFLAGAAAWTVHLQRVWAREQVQARLHAAGTVLVPSLESLLALDEIAAVRTVAVVAAADNGLALCRVRAADGTVLAQAGTGAPAGARVDGEAPAHPAPETRTVQVWFPLQWDSGGEGRLELAADAALPAWAGWEAQAGIGAVGAAGFVALWLVYRQVRTRLGALGAIREALRAMQAGEKDGLTLLIAPHLGPEAQAWNELITERERLRAMTSLERIREVVGLHRDLRACLDSACDALPQGLLVVDEQLQIRYANGAAAAFLRLPRDRVEGVPVAEHIRHAEVLESLRGVVSGSTRRRAVVEVRRSPEEGGGVLRFIIRPMRREDGAGGVLMIEDVTQQRMADEARNAFVAQATHELRTPLTNIRLYVEQAIEAGEHDPALRARCLNVVNLEARRLERIVGDMLSVSEIEAGTFRLRTDDVRLDALFEGLRAEYELAAAEKGLTLRFETPPKWPVIRGDRDKLALALHNLLGNAIKYTPAGGMVTVRVEASGPDVRVDVSDTGIGIAPEEQERIFERFYRSRDQRVHNITGSGLGLALAREVIRLHGGDITVRSQLNQGSTFTITLPAMAQAA